MSRSSERAAVLVIRLWIEPEAIGDVRARLTYVPELPSGEAVERAEQGIKRICERVRTWLEDFERSSTTAPM